MINKTWNANRAKGYEKPRKSLSTHECGWCRSYFAVKVRAGSETVISGVAVDFDMQTAKLEIGRRPAQIQRRCAWSFIFGTPNPIVNSTIVTSMERRSVKSENTRKNFFGVFFPSDVWCVTHRKTILQRLFFGSCPSKNMLSMYRIKSVKRKKVLWTSFSNKFYPFDRTGVPWSFAVANSCFLWQWFRVRYRLRLLEPGIATFWSTVETWSLVFVRTELNQTSKDPIQHKSADLGYR